MKGKPYDISKKSDVLTTYNELAAMNPHKVPCAREIAIITRVSHTFVYKVLKEFRTLGHLEDPIESNNKKGKTRRLKIHPEAALFLLALRTEDDRRPLYSYKVELFQATELEVSTTTIDRFFKKRFDFACKLRKPNLVPLDKWKEKNLIAYEQFRKTIDQLTNHWKFHFIDEKHVVNKDCIGNRVRADPLTGEVRCIKVSGNFRYAYNMISIISANPTKSTPIDYTLGEENGNAASFTAYIKDLIARRWFERGNVLIMDNAAIHTGRESAIVADLLWSVEVDGSPLNVLVVPLPTRSPELNPIELVFHILARRLRLYRYRTEDPGQMTVPHQAARVMADISTETVLKCIGHCGY